jgi:RHS repeat-associated protein
VVNDAAGNLTFDGSLNYTWDAENRLSSVAGVNYSYDGDGQRVQKSSGTTYWYGPDGATYEETDASGNTVANYIYFGGKRFARRDASNNTIYYAPDHLGTTRAILNSTGSTCYDSDFYPFGGEINYTNTCPQNYKFTGKERDAESGLDDFDARYYSSTLGRFVSADWSEKPTSIPAAEFNNPQSLNLYAYVRNNPMRWIDPDGHDVKVDDDTALQRIKSTLPKGVQADVTLDKNRKINKSILNIKSDDPNVKALQGLVKNSGTLELKTGSSVSVNGQKTDFLYESPGAIAAELKGKGINIDPNTLIATLFLGRTDDATETASGKNVLVTISDGTGKAATAPEEEQAVTTAHEMYGHGLLQLQGKAWEHDNHGPVDAKIAGIERHTREVYQQNHH